ncbi:unnamed protein product [Aureobasidium vineae]|uniref:Uncharacterized protein n=1 Tax=Aureobasidium vineae TaxID=2773715 RepID=A0A9N8PHF7_9PEZI|nr:unnamed protein product [Aureobasidium vineae]
MANKVVVSFGVVMAVFIALALVLWGLSAVKHARHDTASHNQQHRAKLDDWIARMRRRTWRNTHMNRDVEMQVPPELPCLPGNVIIRSGAARVPRMGRLYPANANQRVQFCDVTLTPVQGQRGVNPAGFF